MTEEKKGRLVVRLVGVAFILVGILIGVLGSVLPHYTATVTAVSEPKSARSSSSRRRYKVNVDAVYTAGDGTEKEITNLRITRSSKTAMPEIGDTIQVTGGLLRREYRFSTILTTALTFGVMGIIVFFRSFRSVKKKRRR